MPSTALRPQLHRDTRPQEDNRLPPHMANEAFLVVTYPKDWECVPEYGWLPRLGKVIAKPGTNGTGRDRLMGAAIRVVEAKNGQVISPTETRLGGDYDPDRAGECGFRNYLASYECAGGGRCFVFAWEVAEPLGRGEFLWNEEAAEVEALRFRQHLRDSGLAGVLKGVVFQKKLGDAKRRLEKMRGRSLNGNLAPVLVERQEKKISMMEAAWAEYQKLPLHGREAEPVPVTSRRLKPKREAPAITAPASED